MCYDGDNESFLRHVLGVIGKFFRIWPFRQGHGRGSGEQTERGKDERHGGGTGACSFLPCLQFQSEKVVKAVEGPVAEAGNKKSSELQKFVGRRIVDVRTLGKELFLIFDHEICLR